MLFKMGHPAVCALLGAQYWGKPNGYVIAVQ